MKQEKNHTNDNFPSRLRGKMEKFGIRNAAELARFARVSWSTAKQWLEGSIPRKLALFDLASRLHVTAQWLETGEGDKTPVNLEAVLNRQHHTNEMSAAVLRDEQATYSTPGLDATLAYRETIIRLIPEFTTEQLLQLAEMLQSSKPPGYVLILDQVLPMLRERSPKEPTP